MPRSILPRALLSRLRLGGRGTGDPANAAPARSSEDPLLTAGRLLRQAREQRSLNLRQLALETRISTPVLEALERGWRDRLPEAAYLRTMLPLLERHLALPAGCLEVALPPARPRAGRGTGVVRGPRFTPGSIDLFQSWQGSALYGALILGLIYAINLQQQRLAAEGRLALRPIPPLPPGEQSRRPAAGLTLQQAYPELRPLASGARGPHQALARLQQEQQRLGQAEQPGLLALRLSRSSRLQLRSADGVRSALTVGPGELDLPLQPPLELELEPPAEPGGVTWNGVPLEALAGKAGRYRLPMPAAGTSAAAAGGVSRP